jgi:hypothetical protein
MFAATSRYADVPLAELAVARPGEEPRAVRYVTRRPLPAPESTTRLLTHTVIQGERLDNIAARHLGDPTQFWRICDANLALRAGDLVATPGRSLDIPLPGV